MNPVSFTNPTPITIHPQGPASVYASVVNVGGLGGTVADVNVTLSGLSHTRPDDLDVMLVAPNGQAVLLMSDAGGDPDVVNLTLTFDDQAPAPLPDATSITSGLRRPTNYGAGDPFPLPAPTTFTPALSVFNGLPADGSWMLYILDDAGGDAGNLAGGWTLEVVVTPPPTPPGANNYYWAPELNPAVPQNGLNLSASVPGNWRQGPSVSAPVHTVAPNFDDNLYFDGGLNPSVDHDCVVPMGVTTVAPATDGTPPPAPSSNTFAGIHSVNGYTNAVILQQSVAVGVLEMASGVVRQDDTQAITAHNYAGNLWVTSNLLWTGGTLNDNTVAGGVLLGAQAVGTAVPTDGGTVGLGSTMTFLGNDTTETGSSFTFKNGTYDLRPQVALRPTAHASLNFAPVPDGSKPPATITGKVQFASQDIDLQFSILSIPQKAKVTILPLVDRGADETPAVVEFMGKNPTVFNQGLLVIKDRSDLRFIPTFAGNTSGGLVHLPVLQGIQATTHLEAGSKITCTQKTSVDISWGALVVLELNGPNGPLADQPDAVISADPTLERGVSIKSGLRRQAGRTQVVTLKVNGTLYCSGVLEFNASRTVLEHDTVSVTGRITFTETAKVGVQWFDATGGTSLAGRVEWTVITSSAPKMKLENDPKPITGVPQIILPNPAANFVPDIGVSDSYGDVYIWKSP